MKKQVADRASQARMRNWVSSASAIAASLALTGCINLGGGFSGVPLDEIDTGSSAPVEFALAGPDDVFLTVGEQLDIQVEGDEAVLADLRFKLDGDTLGVGRESDWMDSKGKAIIRVTMPAPRSLSLAGSGDIDSETLASDAEISVAGSGKVTIATVAADDLDVSVAGSGSLTASGTARSLDISIAGSGDINFANLKVDDAEISIAGSGDVELASDGRVEASIAGSGDVRVAGNATCQSSAMGSGTVTCRPSAQTAEATQTAGEEAASTE